MAPDCAVVALVQAPMVIHRVEQSETNTFQGL